MMIVREFVSGIIILTSVFLMIVGSLLIDGPPKDTPTQIEDKHPCINWMTPRENLKCYEKEKVNDKVL